jgi:DNA-binding response OmpR family regulator
MAVDVCYDGDAALERVMVHRYDVVILDRDLPLVHGDEVCRRIVAAASAWAWPSCAPSSPPIRARSTRGRVRRAG